MDLRHSLLGDISTKMEGKDGKESFDQTTQMRLSVPSLIAQNKKQ